LSCQGRDGHEEEEEERRLEGGVEVSLVQKVEMKRLFSEDG